MRVRHSSHSYLALSVPYTPNPLPNQSGASRRAATESQLPRQTQSLPAHTSQSRQSPMRLSSQVRFQKRSAVLRYSSEESSLCHMYFSPHPAQSRADRTALTAGLLPHLRSGSVRPKTKNLPSRIHSLTASPSAAWSKGYPAPLKFPHPTPVY